MCKLTSRKSAVIYYSKYQVAKVTLCAVYRDLNPDLVISAVQRLTKLKDNADSCAKTNTHLDVVCPLSV